MNSFRMYRGLLCVLALVFPLLAGCPSEPPQPPQPPQPAGPEASQAAKPCCESAPKDSAPAGALSDLLQAVRSGEEAGRIRAIDLLGVGGAEIDGAVEALIELLQDESPVVRGHAAKALGDIGAAAKPAAKALVALIADEDKLVRREAAEALRDIRPGPEVAIPLFNKLLREADDEVRLYAMDALAEEGKAVVDSLTVALEDEEARFWACLVLAEIGPDAAGAVPALVKLLENEKRLEVRREAMLALAAVGPGAAAAVPALIVGIDSEEGINTGAAVYALGSIGPEAKPAEAKIKELADQEDAPLFRKTVCLWALARINPDDKELVNAAVPQLIAALKAPKREIREAAARALIDLDPDPEITRPLMQEAMRDASPEVLNEVLDALASLGEKAVPRLTEALKHEAVRAKAAAIIARIDPPAKAAVPALIEALGDESPDTRSELLFALAAIGPAAEEAVPAITKALGDSEEDVRYAACFALGKIGPAAMPAKAELQAKLAGDDRFLCMASAWALARIHPECSDTAPKSVPVLIEALGEPDAMTRLHAAESLRCLGPLAKDAGAELKKALEDDNAVVRETAAEALKAIGG